MNIQEMINNAKESSKQPVQRQGATHIASNGQIDYYKDLCEKKGIRVSATMLSAHASVLRKEIDRLKALPNFEPLTDKQRNYIINLCEEMGSKLPANLDVLSKEEAKGVIDNLQSAQKRMMAILPPTDKQLETLALMYSCPDVIFTDLGGEFEAVAVESGIKRAFEVPELIAHVFAQYKRQEVYDFIGKYNVSFEAWKATRVSQDKAERLNALIERSGNERMPDYEVLALHDKVATDLMLKISAEIEAGVGLRKGFEESKDIERKAKTVDEAIERNHAEMESLGNKLIAMTGASARVDHVLDGSDLFGTIVEYVKLNLSLKFATEEVLRELIADVITDGGQQEMIFAEAFNNAPF